MSKSKRRLSAAAADALVEEEAWNDDEVLVDAVGTGGLIRTWFEPGFLELGGGGSRIPPAPSPPLGFSRAIDVSVFFYWTS